MKKKIILAVAVVCAATFGFWFKAVHAHTGSNPLCTDANLVDPLIALCNSSVVPNPGGRCDKVVKSTTCKDLRVLFDNNGADHKVNVFKFAHFLENKIK